MARGDNEMTTNTDWLWGLWFTKDCLATEECEAALEGSAASLEDAQFQVMKLAVEFFEIDGRTSHGRAWLHTSENEDYEACFCSL
jgi:hypothetical protein